MAGFKNNVIKYLARYHYPQRAFASAIKTMLMKQDFKGGEILDCPCGHGQVSHYLSGLKNTEVTGVDIDGSSVAIATAYFKKNNITFHQADIFEWLARPATYDVICIVNSLFLLPDHDRLLSLVHEHLNKNGLFIVITPNTAGPNFKTFQQMNPDVNVTVLSKEEANVYITSNGFNVKDIREIAFVGYYVAAHRLMSIFAPFYLHLLNFLVTFKQQKIGNYILYCYTKHP